MDTTITVNDRQRVMLFNRSAESMFLCHAADVIGQSLDRLIPDGFDRRMRIISGIRAHGHATSIRNGWAS